MTDKPFTHEQFEALKALIVTLTTYELTAFGNFSECVKAEQRARELLVEEDGE